MIYGIPISIFISFYFVCFHNLSVDLYEQKILFHSILPLFLFLICFLHLFIYLSFINPPHFIIFFILFHFI